ncbi:MAG: DUF2802 domain-containing protein [Ketobacteraceae bacterium]|nr:DUF2802 domain-containing protein [Ketobacteraceae bacterium]
MILTTAEWIAYLSVGVSLCLVIALILTQRRHKQALQAQMKINQQLQHSIDGLAQQFSVLNKGTLGMGKRLMTAEKRLNQTMERQDSLENRESEQLSFKQAARLFERGLEMDNVIEKVGITRSEAKLVDMFQQKRIEEFED